MKLEFDKYKYIGCIPYRVHPTHPKDQSPCIIKRCPVCTYKMWVSEKKRTFKKLNPGKIKIVCLECLIRGAIEQEFEPELFDINDIM